MPAVVLMQVVKGMQMEGLRVVGDPADMVRACSPRNTGTFAGVAAGAEVINNHPKHAVCARQAKRYYDEGCDEILYIDVVASLYDRPNLSAIIECVWRMPGCAGHCTTGVCGDGAESQLDHAPRAPRRSFHVAAGPLSPAETGTRIAEKRSRRACTCRSVSVAGFGLSRTSMRC